MTLTMVESSHHCLERRGLKLLSIDEFREYLVNYVGKGVGSDRTLSTQVESLPAMGRNSSCYINEFWTSGQRKCSSIHEVSYRACFKPQLPRFFVSKLTSPGDLVYDPFCGRGTTLVESALLGRMVMGNDVNPLSRILTIPRLDIPDFSEVAERLQRIPIDRTAKAEIDISMFYHPQTEAEIVSIRQYLQEAVESGQEDRTDRWIRMVATNRLTGHSPGFFSVYTLPPNQAVTPERQIALNKKRCQVPQYRDARALILKKTRALLSRVSESELERLRKAASEVRMFSSRASETQELIDDESISLVVTSPPFLNIVQYSSDNWLRCWFNSIDVDTVERQLSSNHSLKDWSSQMRSVLSELFRVVVPGGYTAFEVGEVRNGSIMLDEIVAPLGKEVGFTCELVLVNKQNFSKTSNIWGINNNRRGTNTNRVILFRKPFQQYTSSLS